MLRLTGGEFRGRVIRTPSGEKTRPTQARLRQALFNSIQTQILGSRVLDLFAGSGALAFEALSRGADFACLVENSRAALSLISSNAKDLQVTEKVLIASEGLERGLKKLAQAGPYDLIFADPPYAEGWETKLLESFPWDEVLKPEGLFLLEWGAQKSQVQELPEKTAFLEKIREKNYGDSVLTTYQRLA